MRSTNRPVVERRGRGRVLAASAVAVVLVLLIAACGGGDDDDSASGGKKGGGDSGQTTLKIVQAPDPVWHWMDETGILADMEEEWGIKAEVTETFDWFPIFVGGHADVAQTGTYELPNLDSRGIPSMTFGRYNRAKDLFVVPPDSDAKTLEDLPDGAKVGVYAFGGTTAVWAALLKDSLGGEDFRTSDRWKLVVAATEQLPKLVMNGDLDAAIVDPQLTVTLIAAGKLNTLYDGAPLAKYFAEKTGGPPAVETNLLITTKEWFDSHDREARFYLALWQRGLEEWKEHRHEIIEKYPDDFSITKPSDIDVLENYLDNEFDWFDSEATLDQEFIDSQGTVFDLLKTVGAMEPNAENPEFVALDPGKP